MAEYAQYARGFAEKTWDVVRHSEAMRTVLVGRVAYDFTDLERDGFAIRFETTGPDANAALSKILERGMGYLVAPNAFLDGVVIGMRSTGRTTVEFHFAVRGITLILE